MLILMLNSQLKQLQAQLIRLKSQMVISKKDKIKIKNLEKWFEKFKKAE